MKNKIFVFAGGLVAGLIIGVLFSVAIKELILQFKEVHLSLNKMNLKQSELSQRLDSIQGKLVPDTKKTPNTTLSANTKMTLPGSTKNATQPGTAKSQTQTTAVNTASTIPGENDSDVVIMTNQLVDVQSVHLQNQDTNTVSKKTAQTDSTIAAMSDVSDSREPAYYRVEFWKSPLNYKGYKMSTGKIILYGINPGTPIDLTLQGGDYYLLLNQGAYKVYFTDDYKPFERITDKAILKKLGI